MRLPSVEMMMAPSILASSDSRCGLYGASTRKPPEQIASTSGRRRARAARPALARTTRSMPSRSGVPGATRGQGVAHLVVGAAVPVGHPSILGGRAALDRSDPDAALRCRRRPAPRRRCCTRTSSMPSHGGDDAGTMARRKPMRAASPRRRRAWATWRTSPPRPISPITTIAGADRLVGDRAGHGHRHAEVDARLDEPHAADGRRVDVLVAHAQPGPPLEHGQQQRQPATVEALGVAPRRHARWDRDGQRLDLDEQRALALHRRHDDRAGDAGAPIGEEQLRRVGHARQAGARHLEQPELVGRAEAVLDGPQQAQGVVALALERQHGVDDVLEQARARPARRPW